MDEVTLAKLGALIGVAQAQNNALQAELKAYRERVAVLEAKVAIVEAELAGSREAVSFLKFRAGAEQGEGCEGCAEGEVDRVDMVTGEVYQGCCLRCYG